MYGQNRKILKKMEMKFLEFAKGSRVNNIHVMITWRNLMAYCAFTLGFNFSSK